MTAHKSLRFVHATDMHVVAVNGAPMGWATALDVINALNPPAQFLVNGGDCIGDALETNDRAKVDQLWDLYVDTTAAHNRLPVFHVMGNHDIWGWHAELDERTPGYGKGIAIERMGLREVAYYSFDYDDWHFVVLDNVQQQADDYDGSLDDAQLTWLKADLAANRKPVCLFSHMPLLSIAPFTAGGFAKEDHYRIPYTWMHGRVMPLIDLLWVNNVKLCVSGHLHMVDRIDFLGMTFICNGSICGRWWGGPFNQFAEGFGVFDLFPDGTFNYEYRAFGWDAAKHQSPL
jgi:Icc protein